MSHTVNISYGQVVCRLVHCRKGYFSGIPKGACKSFETVIHEQSNSLYPFETG